MYLSIPPVAMDDDRRRDRRRRARRARRARVILEKPFGTDVDSAKALNARLHSVFAEEQIFRIDHFLGKEDVQNILAIRFANRLFEPMWNVRARRRVQIDVPETLGVENRAQVLRGDRRVPRHGRHAPVPGARLRGHGDRRPAFTADALATEKQRVFDAMQPLDPARSCAGSTTATATLPEVADDSDTETLVAVEARIDNERWDGVPIYLRTGKRMPESVRASSRSRLKQAAAAHVPRPTAPTRPDRLVFEIGEPGSIRVELPCRRSRGPR